MLKTLPALAAIAAATALLVPTVSQAAEQTSVRVPYGDLNLATGAGQQHLQRRIVYAARTVCDIADPRDLRFMQIVGECRTGAIAGAQPAFKAAVAAAQRPSVTVLDAAAALIVTAR